MTPIDKAGRTLLASLAIALAVSCGKPAGPGATFKPAAAADSPPRADGDPLGTLPSLLVAGEVAAFKATSTGAGPLKWRDTAGALPSHVAASPTAGQAPGDKQEAASRMATP